MKPEINKTSFGSIVVEKVVYNNDIIIRLNGVVEKRKKKLSKVVYGTSHTVSLDEINYIFEVGAKGIIIGTGQYGVLELSEEAREFLDDKNCTFDLLSTPAAMEKWNKEQGQVIGLFHVTC